MSEKIIDAAFAYCFSILEVFVAFFERTHAVVGLGVPMLVMIAVHVYLPAWVAAAIAAFVFAPAAAAMVSVIIEGLFISHRR